MYGDDLLPSPLIYLNFVLILNTGRTPAGRFTEYSMFPSLLIIFPEPGTGTEATVYSSTPKYNQLKIVAYT